MPSAAKSQKKAAPKKAAPKKAAPKKAAPKKAAPKKAAPKKAAPKKAAPQPLRKRLKKSVAARAVARVEAEQAAEKQGIIDERNAALQKVKDAATKQRNKERLKLAKKKEKVREKIAESRRQEQEIKQALLKERRAASEAQRAQDSLLRQAALDARAEEKARAKTERNEERARILQLKQEQKAAREQERQQKQVLRLEVKAQRTTDAAEKAKMREENKQKAEAKKLELVAQREAAKEQLAKQRAHAQIAAQIEKAARELERAEAREEAAQLKAAAQAAKEKARLLDKERAAGAKLRAAEDKLAERESKSQLKLVFKDLATQLAEQRKLETLEYGASNAFLARSYIEIFSRREDIVVENCTFGPAWSLDELLSAKEAGQEHSCEAQLWLNEIGAIQFAWSLAHPGKERVAGAFEIDLSSQENSAISEQLEQQIERALILVPEAASSTAQVELLTKLKQCSSLPLTSHSTIQEVLASYEIEAKQIKVLSRWLGPRLGLLLHKGATPEGRRRMEVMTQQKGTPSAGRVNRVLIDALNQGAPVEKKEWLHALEAHLSFLASAELDNQYQVELVNGLPEARWGKATADTEQPVSFRLENLSQIKDPGALLAWADFCGARGDRIQLPKAELRGALFIDGHFEGAKFAGADLTGANFSRARLAGADFKGANLTDTNFEQADLSNAQFSGATVAGTAFGGANVRGIKY